jgi:GxxExxY protein
MNADKRGFLRGFVTELIGLKYREVTDVTLGVFYDVYNELGFGFLESVYREAMCLALTQKGLEVEKEVAIPVYFRGRKISEFRCDLLVNRCLILELKAIKAIDSVCEAQTLNYLRATEIEVALLLNFGPKPTFRRLVFENSRKQIRENPRSSAAGVS